MQAIAWILTVLCLLGAGAFTVAAFWTEDFAFRIVSLLFAIVLIIATMFWVDLASKGDD